MALPTSARKQINRSRAGLAAYVSGGVCGTLWLPAVKGGAPFRKDARGPWGFYQEGDGWSFRDALDSLLRRIGGDFQNAKFTADTYFRLERRTANPSGKGYTVRVWEREISALPDCADLVDVDAMTGDFMGGE